MSKRALVIAGAAGLSVSAIVALNGCANIVSPVDDNYRLGAMTRTYCETTDPAVRKVGRMAALRTGTTLPDMCGALGIDYVESVDGD